MITDTTYVPSWGTVKGLGSVVVALAVTSDEQQLVVHVLRRLLVHGLDEVVESLPSGELRRGLLVSAVSLVDETEVDGSLE